MIVSQLIEALQQMPPHYPVVHNAIDTGLVHHIDFIELNYDGSSPVVSACFDDDLRLELTAKVPSDDGWYWYQECEGLEIEPVLVRFDEYDQGYFALKCGDRNWKEISSMSGMWSTKPLITPLRK